MRLLYSLRFSLLFCFLFLFAGAVRGEVVIDGDTPWIISTKDYENPAIRAAIRNVEEDWYKVFGYPPVVFSDGPRGHWTGPVVVFGSAENTRHLLDAKMPEGKERYRVFATSVQHNDAIVGIGGDTRGTIYALYSFAEEILGVDPMYIFTDSSPKKRVSIELSSDFDYTPDAPTFEHRGWFINDEEIHDGLHRDPLNGNVISMEWQDKIIESLLRCKGNMLIPESSPYPDQTAYDLCARRGVIITHHHIAPLGVNMMDWPEGVPFSFMSHKDILIDAWTKAAKAQSDKEVAWIIGFRGESDGAFWHSDPDAPEDAAGRGAVIGEAMQIQTDIVRAFDPDATIVAALWNEQGYLFHDGHLKIPDGVCTMFADDGRGYMRDEGGKHLKAGDGLYYHTMMMMNTQNRTTEAVPPARIYDELRRYVEKGATKYAIINVSSIRPAVMSTHAMMDFLWDADPALSKSSEDSMRDYMTDWYSDRFGEELGADLAKLREHYFQIPYMRAKPPVSDGYWRGARAEHLMQYKIQLLLNRYLEQVLAGQSIDMPNFKSHLSHAVEPLVECDEFFPGLWNAVLSMESRIDAKDLDFYQFHFVYQTAIHMYSSQALKHVVDAYEGYVAAGDAKQFSEQLELALADIEQVIDSMHAAEYGAWDTMFMHVRLLDTFRTRLLLKQSIARLRGDTYTDQYRGFQHGSFWRSAQYYMRFEEGTFPYFFPHSGRGLDVLEK